ncbi:hypothetical protein FAGKG844_100102 [Frankia sp. AgKG'84/4]|nr:hypothetical protein [Frankia sp. AgKG'84/4]
MVTDARRRAALADVFRRAVAVVDPGVSRLSHRDVQRMTMPSRSMTQMVSGFQHLYDNIHRIPAIVVPCVEGRTDGASALTQSMTWGSILPAVWSFMLAARARGLFRIPLVENHADKEGKRIVGQQLVRLVDLAQVQSHARRVA